MILDRHLQIVPQGYPRTVEWFGVFTCLLHHLLNLMLPLVESVGRKINVP